MYISTAGTNACDHCRRVATRVNGPEPLTRNVTRAALVAVAVFSQKMVLTNEANQLMNPLPNLIIGTFALGFGIDIGFSLSCKFTFSCTFTLTSALASRREPHNTLQVHPHRGMCVVCQARNFPPCRTQAATCSDELASIRPSSLYTMSDKKRTLSSSAVKAARAV